MFADGWDETRERRLARQREMGVVPADTVLPARNDKVEPWADHSEVPARTRMGMSTAAAEVGNNILEHAGHGRNLRVRMELRVLGDQVRVEFTDDGHPAEIDLARVDMPDPMAESGRGLALARAFCSVLSYRRDADGNHWTLVSQPFDTGAPELMESSPLSGQRAG